MQTWKSGSTPPPGEYEFIAGTGGRSRAWVGDGFVIINGNSVDIDKVFQIGTLVGPIDDDEHP